MSSTETHDCAVCTKKTTQRCGGCSSLFFCSRDCQKLVWSTHKWTCKNGGVFAVAPLTADEVNALTEREDTASITSVARFGGAGASILEEMRRNGLYEGEWEPLMHELSNPPSDMFSPAIRTILICTLRSRLTDSVTSGIVVNGVKQPVMRGNTFPQHMRLQPWHHICQSVLRVTWAIIDSGDGSSSLDSAPFTDAYPYFHQMLIAHTLYFSYVENRWNKRLKELGKLAFSRAAVLVEGSTLPSGLKQQLPPFIARTAGLFEER
ncbi:hypothetical protein JCM8097_000978 [Rhodosporidiobolus ruineniae]